MGQSTTLTGRCIARHMSAKVNELFTGKYDYRGDTIVYGDTDSVAGDTVVETSQGPMTIEELFERCNDKEIDQLTKKEYGYDDDIMVMSYCPKKDEPYFGHINYVYKHPVSKQLYDIEDEFGNVVTVTEDHSVMVERNSKLIEVKPANILDSDILISVKIS